MILFPEVRIREVAVPFDKLMAGRRPLNDRHQAGKIGNFLDRLDFLS
jgi:hypothetical protein